MTRYTFVALLLTIIAHVHILRAQSLSSTVVREGYQMWEPSLDSATQIAMRHLNKDKSSHQNLHLYKMDPENTKVAQGVMYTLGLEMDMGTTKGLRYELSFHQPEEWRPLWGSLPPAAQTSTPLSTALSLRNEHHFQQPQQPELSMTLRGPLEVYIHDLTTSLHIKTPREVDVGIINKIVLAPGTNMTVSGFSEMRLQEPLSVTALPVVSNGVLLMEVKNTPKLTLIGRRVDVTNATANEVLKVRKTGTSEIEIRSATEEPVRSQPTQFEIPLNDPRLQVVQYAMSQLAQSAHSSQQPILRRLFSTKLEAVNGFVIPLEVSDENGETSDWEVSVVQGPNTPGRVVSAHRKQVGTQLAFDWALVMNGTLASAVQDFTVGRPEYKLAQNML